MKFSLVLATVGRVEELKRFLESLVDQHYAGLELFVIDQNPDDRLEGLIESYGGRFPVRHLRSVRGLSRARNVGLGHIAGDIVAFPDDDCWYPERLLASVAHVLEENVQWDGLTALPVTASGETLQRKWGRFPGPITRENVWSRGVSITLFLRRHVVESVGSFDESLGVGAPGPWQSGEETDYILRAIEKGFRLQFEPGIRVCHPRPKEAFDPISRAREYKNSCGMGRVLRKHHYPLWLVVRRYIIRPMGGAIVSVATGRWQRSLFYGAVLRGRLRGLTSR